MTCVLFISGASEKLIITSQEKYIEIIYKGTGGVFGWNGPVWQN